MAIGRQAKSYPGVDEEAPRSSLAVLDYQRSICIQVKYLL